MQHSALAAIQREFAAANGVNGHASRVRRILSQLVVLFVYLVPLRIAPRSPGAPHRRWPTWAPARARSRSPSPTSGPTRGSSPSTARRTRSPWRARTSPRTGVEVELREGDLLAPLVARRAVRGDRVQPALHRRGRFPVAAAEVQREPRGALLAGADGLDAIRRLVDGAPPLLAPGGVLALEVGMGQAPATAQLMRDRGFSTVDVRKDLAGIERVVLARR